MEDTTQEQLPDTQPKRPNMLTILCILTFIWSGLYLFSNLVIAGFYDVFLQIAPEISEKFKLPGIDQLLAPGPVFFIVSAVLFAGSIAGAILMMRQKKAGFHIYTIFQILLILATMYFLHLPAPGLFDLVFSGLFIYLYSMNLKFMT